MTFGFLFGSKNFCKLLSVSCEVFVLHGYDWIRWVAKSCTTTAYRWLFRDSQPSHWELCDLLLSSHQKFVHEVRLCQYVLCMGPCNFGPLTDLAISVFWEVSFNIVFTQIHTSRRRRLQRWFMRRTGVWVSVFKNSFIHKILSEFLQPFRYVGMTRVSPHLFVIIIFFGFGILVGLFNNSSNASEEYGSLRTCLSTLSLDTIVGRWSEWSISFEGVVCVEVDELEEDVGWSISCLEGVMGVEVDKLEEELADKPGTTIGTKFSVSHCIWNHF